MRYPVRSCGKRHGHCKVCRPDIDYKKALSKRYSGIPVVGSSISFPQTKWERYAEEHDIEVKTPMESLGDTHYISDLPQRGQGPRPQSSQKMSQKPDQPFTEVLKEIEETGRNFTTKELRQHFGFTWQMAVRYLHRPSAEHEARLQRWEEREKKIIELRLTPGITLQVIAEQVGVTRERVRQILVRAEQKYNIQLPHGFNSTFKKEEPIVVAFRCVVCGKIKEVPEDRKDAWHNKFCKEHSMGKYGYNAWKTTGAKWWAMADKERSYWVYHNDPAKKQMVSKSAHKAREKMKADPVRYAAHRTRERAYLVKYYARKQKEARQKQMRPFIKVPEHGD